MTPGIDRDRSGPDGNLARVARRLDLIRCTAALILSGVAASACTSREPVDPNTIEPIEREADDECPVSELLVPECGVWFGSSIPPLGDDRDPLAGLQQYEAFAQSAPDIVHFYQRGPTGFPAARHLEAAERPGRPRSIMYFSWKPDLELTWREIADGAADATIASVALDLVQYPHLMFFTVHHEPENDVDLTPGSGMTPADYVDMYRHVVEMLRELGADNLVFVMVYMGFDRWAGIVDDLYPGDDVVDWIGYDPYGFEAHTSFELLLNRPNPELEWPGFYDWATAKAPGKPIMVAEWGYDMTAITDAESVLGGAPEILQTRFPAIKALVYWNQEGDRVNARLDQPTPEARRFAEAFAELARDPLFEASSTASAP